MGTFFLRAGYAHHIVHHLRMFRRDHVTQFSSPEEEARLRSGLVAQGARPRRGAGLRATGGGPWGVPPTSPRRCPCSRLRAGWGGVVHGGAALPHLAMRGVRATSPSTGPERAAREAPALLVPCSRRAISGSWPGTTGSITGTRTATTTSSPGGTSCWASTTGGARGNLPRCGDRAVVVGCRRVADNAPRHGSKAGRC